MLAFGSCEQGVDDTDIEFGKKKTETAASVFEEYRSFTLTSKQASDYWDFEIAVQQGQRPAADGSYIFFIPKVTEGKKINMVFIGGFVEKPETPPVVDPDPVGPYVTTVLSGRDLGGVVNATTEVAGNSLPEYRNTGINRAVYPFDAIAMADGSTTDALRWAWQPGSPNVWGSDQQIVIEHTFNVPGDVLFSYATELVFAADNAMAVWINGALVGITPATDFIDDENIRVWDPNGWVQPNVVNPKLLDSLIRLGENTIRILVKNANAADEEIDAAGFLFALEVHSDDAPAE